MQFLLDYFPIVVFFISYKIWNIYVATALSMLASVLQIAVYWLMYKRCERAHVITMVLIMVLGSITLLLHDPIFIQWKPTIIYWIFSLALLGSQFIGSRCLIQRLLAEKVTLPIPVWKKLNTSWAVFFMLLGMANLYVVYHYSTNAWVNFKLFGTLGLLILFSVAQSIYMTRHAKKQ